MFPSACANAFSRLTRGIVTEGNSRKRFFHERACCAGTQHHHVWESRTHTYELDESEVSQQVLGAVQIPVTSHCIHFRPHDTAGGGDCGIHALCGEVSQGRYYCAQPRQLLLRSFDGGYDQIDMRLQTADPDGAFWPHVQKYIWQELFVETWKGRSEIEGCLFLRVFKETQPDVHAQARAFLEQEASRRERQQALWESMQESARALFTLRVWKTVVQHALIFSGVLPSVSVLVGLESQLQFRFSAESSCTA